MNNVNFGTYHHSTQEESDHIRSMVEKKVHSIFSKLYPISSALQILDAGCGLGFMSYLAATYYPQSFVTGYDIYNDESLKDSSLEKAIQNMKSLGLESRTKFKKHDLAESFDSGVEFDLVISNLVFHNMGKNRFKAYENVFDSLKEGGYFVIGDLFPENSRDMKFLLERSTLLLEEPVTGEGKWDLQFKTFLKGSPK